MIFDLPAILGILPIILYAILTLRGIDPHMAAIVGIIVGAVFTQKSIIDIGNALYASLGSFLGLIGFIIMMGAGLGEVLTRTKVAHNIVHLVLEKLRIKTPSQGIFITMIVSTVLVAMLGTVAGANAIIAPIVIPILATIGTKPGTLGVAFFGGGFAGLVLGPFTPNVVTIMGVTGVSYPTYLLCGGIPMAIVIWVCSYLMALRTQKVDESEHYSESDALDTTDLVRTPAIKRGSITFVVLMIVMLAYGVYAKAGASYSLMVMLIVGFATGKATGMSLKDSLHTMMEGCTRLYKMFFIFIIINPFLVFVTESGAFEAIAGYLQPLADSGGQVLFMLITALIGIFGISGASVAQAVVIHEMFYPSVIAMGAAMSLWIFNVLIGSILTSFAFPGPDNLGALALARSSNIKAALKMGYVAIGVGLVVLVIRSVIGI